MGQSEISARGADGGVGEPRIGTKWVQCQGGNKGAGPPLTLGQLGPAANPIMCTLPHTFPLFSPPGSSRSRMWPRGASGGSCRCRSAARCVGRFPIHAWSLQCRSSAKARRVERTGLLRSVRQPGSSTSRAIFLPKQSNVLQGTSPPHSFLLPLPSPQTSPPSRSAGLARRRCGACGQGQA